MVKFNYQKDLALTVCAASSTIARMIPPSTTLIIYAILAEASIARMILAGFIPGFFSMGVYALMIWLRCRFDRTLGPASPPVPWTTRLISLKYLLPAAVIMLTIIGGIFFGIFTATEAAGMAAVVSLLLVIVMRRLTKWDQIKRIVLESCRLTVLVMVLIVSVQFFVKFLNYTRVTVAFAEMALGLPSPYVTLGVMIFIMFIMGMFIGGPLMYVTVPLFCPVMDSLGFNLIWFGIIFIKMSEAGSMSPPVCINLFIAQGIVEEVPMERAYKSIWWFLACDLITALLFILIPQISLWLPQAAFAGE
jgi:tripartite ATP-independent transporter DctM subunit